MFEFFAGLAVGTAALGFCTARWNKILKRYETVIKDLENDKDSLEDTIVSLRGELEEAQTPKSKTKPKPKLVVLKKEKKPAKKSRTRDFGDHCC